MPWFNLTLPFAKLECGKRADRVKKRKFSAFSNLIGYWFSQKINSLFCFLARLFNGICIITFFPLNHFQLCRDYPNNSMELSKLQFACPVCLKRFALASFVKHNGCGPPVSLEEAQEALSYAEVQSTRIDSSKPLSKKRQSIARCIDFKDVYGSTPADGKFLKITCIKVTKESGINRAQGCVFA